MTPWPIELWLFHPTSNSPATLQAKELMEAECRPRHWTLVTRPTHRMSLGGRPIDMVSPQDATNIYKRAHRARVGAWQIGNAHVPIRPKPAPRATDYTTLRTFLSHKAHHARLPDQSTLQEWNSSLETFLSWIREANCDNEADPRCLPLHVFATTLTPDQLSSPQGRSNFNQAHGPQSSRVDDRDLTWRRGPPHGANKLQVAGRDLITGFHWDVTGTQRQKVSNTTEVWEIKSNGYLNVYPDAYIRSAKGKARRLYP